MPRNRQTFRGPLFLTGFLLCRTVTEGGCEQMTMRMTTGMREDYNDVNKDGDDQNSEDGEEVRMIMRITIRMMIIVSVSAYYIS